jgi:integrase/recombinase XerD
MAAFPASSVAPTDQLVERAAVAACLGRYRGQPGCTPNLTYGSSSAGVPARTSTRSVRRGVDIERYVRWLRDGGYQPSTVSRRLSVVVGFYRLCVIDQNLPRSPADYVR